MKQARILLNIPHTPSNETFFNEEVYARLNSLGEVYRPPLDRPLTEEELAAALPGHQIIVTGWGQVPFTEQVLAQATDLELIAHCGGSVARYCGPEVYGRGIRVISGNDVFAESVAEAVLAYILAALRDIPFYDAMLKAGGWRGDLRNEGLFNKSIGLVGFGAIPRFLLPMLKPFNCRVTAYDPYVSEEEMAAYGVRKSGFAGIFSANDIVSVHLPSNPSTRGLITEKELRTMKVGALLINTARASVMDEEALARILHEGRLRAVLDVFSAEPLPAESALRTAPNTILIPHMAGPTLDRRIDTSATVVSDIERWLMGKELKHEIKAEKAAMMTR